MQEIIHFLSSTKPARVFRGGHHAPGPRPNGSLLHDNHPFFQYFAHVSIAAGADGFLSFRLLPGYKGPQEGFGINLVSRACNIHITKQLASNADLLSPRYYRAPSSKETLLPVG